MLQRTTRARKLNSNYWKYWSGQTISSLGSSVTMFSLPLLVYKLTGSALNLGISTAANMLPYLFFGLLIGAWTDRYDRKRLMISADIARALVIATIPLAAWLGWLSVWWIYAVGFIQATIGISFDSSEFAAVPSLVDQDDLVTANGRIEASYSAASMVGPILAGVLVAFLSLPVLLLLDAASFLISALSIALITIRFNNEEGEQKKTATIFQDILEGLRYVWGHPVLRNISIMMALVNFVSTTQGSQLVLFAKQRLAASDTQVGLLYAAGSLGVVVIALLAGPLRKRWSFSRVALSALMLNGLAILIISFLRQYWIVLVLQALASGCGILFNINTGSLRQAIVPRQMLGRVRSIASVLAWSAIPLGALLGGWLINLTHNVALIYCIIGILVILIPAGFALTPLGHADRYLPKAQPEQSKEGANAERS